MDCKIKTDRLVLYPASDRQMQALITKEDDPELKKAYSEMLDGCLREPFGRVWFAAWFLELREEPGVIVGDLCFKGAPKEGRVEIGYGLREGFCKKGYMREALRAIIEWAFLQPGVTALEAETEPQNIDSQKLLAACGFLPTGEVGEEGPRFIRKK
ncbi:MAG: GNAT family N-acetyltransferase [Clostridia bacterium]|nr:GNAT family N-acetyltransferase [Clostridia bacterium]